MAAEPVIIAEGLQKSYGDTHALRGVDLYVDEGTVLAVLGPNGAGKTTAVRILTTLLQPDAGTARVAGVDVLARPQEVRRRIGVSGQYSAVDEYLTGRENLVMVGRLYHLGRSASAKRADELLEQFALTDAADRPSKTYSGGMRRRLDLAAALVAHPPVIFLDEPTTGLDPRARNELWDVIREQVARGATLLLTTQYLEEADQLADRISVIDHGRVIAEGTSKELKATVGGERVELTAHDAAGLAQAAEVLERVAGVPATIDPTLHHATVAVERGVEALGLVLAELNARGVDVEDISIRRPTLDEVFLRLTGHPADDTTDNTTQEVTP
jgi:ABC-2 type transport system ATP-binding protein